MSEEALALQRPRTLKELALKSDSLEEFGYNLRDWQHEISRVVTSRKELAARLREAPRLLSAVFDQGDVADAYLAAYADWLAAEAKIERPKWTKQTKRVAKAAWYADANREQLEAATPEAFRARGIHTIPEPVFKPRRGRPRVSMESKRIKAAIRQKAYRRRIKSLVERARAAGL